MKCVIYGYKNQNEAPLNLEQNLEKKMNAASTEQKSKRCIRLKNWMLYY